MILLKNEGVYRIDYLKNERVCVEKCQFLRVTLSMCCTGNLNVDTPKLYGDSAVSFRGHVKYNRYARRKENRAR